MTSDADPIELVTRGDLALLRAASEELRRLAREAHGRRAHEARGPRQQFGSCCCGYGDATDKDAACEAAEHLRWIVDRWSSAERKADGR